MSVRPIDADALKDELMYLPGGYAQSFAGKACLMAIDSAPTLGPTPKWISVKDRLPENNDTYIVTVNDGIQPFSTWEIYHQEHGWCTEGGKITHWMPLPEPPKKGDAE